MKAYAIVFLIVASLVIFIELFEFMMTCRLNGCNRFKADDSQYCEAHTCSAKDCYEAVDKDSIDYCKKHQLEEDERIAKEEARIAALPDCRRLECNNKVDANGKSQYCPEHTCLEIVCYNYAPDGENYCINHRCVTEGCHNLRATGDTLCRSCKNKKSEETYKKNQAAKKKTVKKTTTKKTTKKRSMPDPDDYDSYDDFMDDWDGYMPDGSDAEDYWEDW